MSPTTPLTRADGAPVAGTSGPRWVAAGASSAADPTTAGVEAARGALSGPDPRLVVVFASPAYDLSVLLRAIRSVTGSTPLVGCSTAGEIASSGPGDAGVAVLAIGGSGFSVATGVGRASSGRLREAGAEAAACLDAVSDRPHRVVLLLTDGLAGDQQEVVRGAYMTAGAAVPLVGGCAGDDLRMERTYQFLDGEVLEDAVLAAAISSDAPLGVGVRHGWRRVGEPWLVTHAEGTKVLRLGDRPALDVYLERLQAPAEVRSDAAAFTRFAMTHPLGMSRRSGEEVRFIAGADFDERSLQCIAEVRQGGLAWIMEGDNDSILEAVDAACSDALTALEGRRPIGVLAFDCIARRAVLGEVGIRREVDRIGEHVGQVPLAGFYTYGEIARTRGISGFHNQTLVVLALS